jgi:hypothetical protein
MSNDDIGNDSRPASQLPEPDLIKFNILLKKVRADCSFAIVAIPAAAVALNCLAF